MWTVIAGLWIFLIALVLLAAVGFGEWYDRRRDRHAEQRDLQRLETLINLEHCYLLPPHERRHV